MALSSQTACGSPPRAGKRPRSSFTTWSVSQTGSPPRAGTKHLPINAVFQQTGSPPRAGTKLHLRGVQHELHGITPARGDETSRRAAAPCARTDHPRARGRNTAIPRSVSRNDGSPPRAGTKLLLRNPHPERPADHPRARGRNLEDYAGTRDGSTDHPRARGRNRVWAPTHQLPSKDHPRARGRNAVHRVPPQVSSDHPRARGRNS